MITIMVRIMNGNKRFLVALTGSLFLFMGCNRLPDIPVTTKLYYASLEKGNTRTSISDDYSVNWEIGDNIYYFSSANGELGCYSIEENCKVAKLHLNVKEDASFLIAAHTTGSVMAGYSGSRFVINGVISGTQSGRFSDTHISVAKTYDINNNTLVFKNLTCYLKFTLNRTDVSYILFSSNEKEALHGNGTVICTFDGEQPSASFSSETGYQIKIATNGPGDYFIATLPCTLLSGFTFQCYDDDDELLAEVKTEKQLIIAENQIINLGLIDSHLIEKEKPIIHYKPNLSESGTANCYIVPQKGEYYFSANVIGNSTTPIEGDATGVKVLWESNATYQTTHVGDIISDVHYSDGKIYFTSTGKSGNAVVALINRDEDVIWSWHIWCVMGYDPVFYQNTYSNNAGILMDRNLGAVSANPLKTSSYGLYYQLGRKDPFIGAATSSTDIPYPVNVSSLISSGNTLDYSIKHPTTLIYSNSSQYDWYSVTPDVSSEGLWGTTKTVYDPCPPGWRVSSSIWGAAIGSWKNIDYPDLWMGGYIDLSDYSDGTAFYPAAGYFFQGSFRNPGRTGMYGTYSEYGWLYFWKDCISPTSSGYGHERENAVSIRCQRDD